MFSESETKSNSKVVLFGRRANQFKLIFILVSCVLCVLCVCECINQNCWSFESKKKHYNSSVVCLLHFGNHISLCIKVIFKCGFQFEFERNKATHSREYAVSSRMKMFTIYLVALVSKSKFFKWNLLRFRTPHSSLRLIYEFKLLCKFWHFQFNEVLSKFQMAHLSTKGT